MEALRVEVQDSKFIDDRGNEISFTFSAGIASLEAYNIVNHYMRQINICTWQKKTEETE